MSGAGSEEEVDEEETLQILAGVAHEAHEAGQSAEAEATPSAAPYAAASPLRCCDATHPMDCIVCTRAPTTEEGVLFELVGDAGKKNGERILAACDNKHTNHISALCLFQGNASCGSS